jgi:hypothetical protein
VAVAASRADVAAEAEAEAEVDVDVGTNPDAEALRPPCLFLYGVMRAVPSLVSSTAGSAVCGPKVECGTTGICLRTSSGDSVLRRSARCSRGGRGAAEAEVVEVEVEAVDSLRVFRRDGGRRDDAREAEEGAGVRARDREVEAEEGGREMDEDARECGRMG